MSTAFVVGAELVVGDRFSLPLDRLMEKLETANKGVLSLQERFEKLGLGAAVKRIDRQWAEIDKINQGGIDRVLKSWGVLDAEGGKAFGGLVRGAEAALGEVLTATTRMQADVLEEMKATSIGSVEALKGIGSAAPELFAPIATSAAEASRAAIASVEGITGAMRAASVEMKGLGAVSAATAAGGGVGGASLATRTIAAHGQNNRAHGGHSGMHLRAPGFHVPGGHVGFGQGGDGMVPLVAGIGLGEMVKEGLEKSFDLQHWKSQYAAAGFNDSQIKEAERAAWENAGRNPNASVIDGMKNILELNKATGHLEESIKLLPLFSTAEMAMQSVKAEGLHSKFNGGTQILNLAKGLEEMGVTTRGDTDEERQANIVKTTNELLRTMIASRGLFDGNRLFAMTNNSGGAAQNWDMRFGTTIAPIIGDIMNHSKLGNADYMSLKSFQGGHITPDAVAALVKYHLATTGEGGDAFQDQKGNWHLKANSNFAKGMESNLFDWSGGVIEKLKANGYDTEDQKFMNGLVNEIGSNKSNSMLMRAVLEPGTRRQIQKEIDLRDQVPNNAAGVLQKEDPVLKLDALHKKFEDLFTALGGPITDTAIKGLTKLTAGVQALSQVMEAHPVATKYGAEAAAAGAVGLTAFGGAKMLGLLPSGGGQALSHAATELDASALALKEAAVALGGGHGVPATATPSAPGKGGKGPGGALMEGVLSGALYEYGKAAMDKVLGWTPKNQEALDHATSLSNVIQDVKKDWFGVGAPEAFHTPSRYDREMRARMGGDGQDHSLDGVILGSNDAGKKLGELKDRTGFVLTSFDTLKGGGVVLNDNFKALSTGAGTFGTGLGGASHELDVLALAARTVSAAFASLLQSIAGGLGGAGGGIISASFGGGAISGGGWNGSALPVGSGFGGGGWSKSGATQSDVASYIKAHAAAMGIDPNVALRVAQSEGLGSYVGDYGTSFGAFQLHYGGSGIRGMNSGGLGDRFTHETGLNARDPTTWKAQVDYALKTAKREGWSAWHGAAHVGIGARQGLDYHGPAPTVDGRASGKTSSPGAPAKGGSEHHDIEAAVHRALGKVKLEVAMTYDRAHQKAVTRFVVAEMASRMTHPTSTGGPSQHTAYVHPGVPVTDAA